MTYKRWYIAFFCVFTSTCLFIMMFNYIVDPFGAFGDKFLKMYNYDMSQNIRFAKISYLDKNFKDFDSYIIGGSKSGALTPEIVNKYYPDSHFYNLNMIGGRFYDYEKTIHYIVDNYKVKNIVFQISQLEADKPDTSSGITGMLHGKLFSDFPFNFYFKVLFQNPSNSIKKLQKASSDETESDSQSFYNIKSGSYNYYNVEKRIQNEPDKYFSDKTLFPGKNPQIVNTVFDYNINILKRIVDFCKQKGINLLVIASPTYKDEIDAYPLDELSDYMKRIASVTSYWNFSGYNSIEADKTNFYNNDHFRVKIAEMMMACIFGDNSVKRPGDFGKYVAFANADEVLNIAMSRK